MLQKRDYVAGTIIIYLFLWMLYFLMLERHTIDTPCNFGKPCIRFCCKDESACNEKYIRETFNKSIYEKPYREDDETVESFYILHGKPRCSMELILKSDTEKEWSMSYYGNIIMEKEDIYIDSDSYCFQEVAYNETLDWNLMVCKSNVYWQHKIRILSFVVSILFLSATIFVHAYVPELRSTISGKILLILLLSYFFIVIGMVMSHFRFYINFLELIFIFAFLSCYFWMAILTFDVWYSLRNFQKTTDDAKRFKIYWISTVGTAFAFVFTIFVADYFEIHRHMGPFIMNAFFIIFLLAGLCDAVFLILSLLNVFVLSKSSELVGSTKFEAEKERFWSVVMIYATMLATWPLEMNVFRTADLSSESVMIADIIKCLTSIVIFCIFVMKDNVKILLIDRYGSLKSGHLSLLPEEA